MSTKEEQITTKEAEHEKMPNLRAGKYRDRNFKICVDDLVNIYNDSDYEKLRMIVLSGV